MIERTIARAEASAAGRVAITVVIVAFVLSMISSNLPGSALTAELDEAVRPVRNAVGLDENWGVFSPGPRRMTISLVARLDYDDGSSRLWTVPEGNDLLDQYRAYRWGKWMERAYSDSHRFLWEPLTRWLARTQHVDGAPPHTVTLVRRWRDTPPPDADGAAPAWQQEEFFSFQVPPGEGS